MSECVQQLPLPCLKLGEGPYWVEQQQALLVVDVNNNTLIKYYVNSGRIQHLHIGMQMFNMESALDNNSTTS
ncbi:hypothetical protein E2C01_079723 [Portunus trituberculatus]|uniref:Uncharacterized protein n=1 Tax=Portunus trituberculatus TaxID=210409 RepID=A0A5B7IWD4_PORTR|nr:hypothetical protein [Portunus trituberculatus]